MRNDRVGLHDAATVQAGSGGRTAGRRLNG